MIKKFTAVALTLLAMVPMYGATLTEEEWANYASISPRTSDKTLTTLGPKLVISPKGTKNHIKYVGSGLTPTLTLPDGTEVSGLFGENPYGFDTGEVAAMFGVSYDVAGDYVLTIPANSLQVSTWSDSEVYGTNPEMKYVYTILGEQEPLTNYLENYVLTPASGSTVHSIYRNLRISFPDVTEDMSFSRVYIGGVQLTTPSGDEVPMLNFEVPLDEDGRRSLSSTVFYFSQVQREEGEYTLKIAQGTFRITVPDVTSPTGVTALYNPAITAKFILSEEIDPNELTLESYYTEPSNAGSVSSLSQLSIVFPQVNAPEQGIEAGSGAGPDDPVCTAPAKKVESKVVTDLSRTYLRNDYSGAASYCKKMEIAESRDKVTFFFDEIKSDGYYTLYVGDEVVVIRDTFPVIYNLPMVIPFRLNYVETGVEEVNASADEVAPVFDMMGRKVLENAVKADIDRLPAGLYIHNGEKYEVR